jgi:hypothetical protein
MSFLRVTQPIVALSLSLSSLAGCLTPSISDRTSAVTTGSATGATSAGSAFILPIEGINFDFGNLATAVSRARSFTLKNFGAVRASNLSLSLTSTVFTLSNNTCTSATLAQNETCSFQVSFQSSTATGHTASLRVSYTPQGSTTAESFSLTLAATTVAGLDSSLNPQAYSNPNTLPSPAAVVSGTPAIVTIAGTPVLVQSNGSTWSAIAASSLAQVSADSSTLAFSSVTASPSPVASTLSIIWRNTGGLPASSVNVAYSGTGDFTLGSTTCSSSLTVASTCTSSVTFTPSTLGAHSGTVTLTYNNGLASSSSAVTLSGTGAAPSAGSALLVLSSGPTLEFGTYTIGQVSSSAITLVNGGTGAATAIQQTAGALLASPFSFVGGTYPGAGGTCGSTLAAGASCTLRVAFTPAGAGSFSQNLSLSYSTGGATLTATRALAGVGYTVPQVSTGGDFGCAKLSTGAVKCWGYNGGRQLGLSDTTDRLTPTALPDFDGSTPATSAVKVSAGVANACVVLANGTVKCWGSNLVGAIGAGGICWASCGHVGPTTVVNIDGSSPENFAVDIVVARLATCAIMQNGAVKCWGMGDSGELGNGGTGTSGSPVTVIGFDGSSASSRATHLWGGGTNTNSFCARNETGAVKCWGRNNDGRFGLGADTTNKSTPVEIPDLANPVDLRIGGSHICVIKSDNRVYCAGYGYAGGLGTGELDSPYQQTTFTTPMTLDSIGNPIAENATHLWAGHSSGNPITCVRFNNGSVKCTGSGAPFGSNAYRLFDYRNPGGTVATTDVARFGEGGNGNVICMIRNNDTVMCSAPFGNSGQVGDGSGATAGAYTGGIPLF